MASALVRLALGGWFWVSKCAFSHGDCCKSRFPLALGPLGAQLWSHNAPVHGIVSIIAQSSHAWYRVIHHSIIHHSIIHHSILPCMVSCLSSLNAPVHGTASFMVTHQHGMHVLHTQFQRARLQETCCTRACWLPHHTCANKCHSSVLCKAQGRSLRYLLLTDGAVCVQVMYKAQMIRTWSLLLRCARRAKWVWEHRCKGQKALVAEPGIVLSSYQATCHLSKTRSLVWPRLHWPHTWEGCADHALGDKAQACRLPGQASELVIWLAPTLTLLVAALHPCACCSLAPLCLLQPCTPVLPALDWTLINVHVMCGPVPPTVPQPGPKQGKQAVPLPSAVCLTLGFLVYRHWPRPSSLPCRMKVQTWSCLAWRVCACESHKCVCTCEPHKRICTHVSHTCPLHSTCIPLACRMHCRYVVGGKQEQGQLVESPFLLHPVESGTAALYSSPVAVLDFASLYPSIYRCVLLALRVCLCVCLAVAAPWSVHATVLGCGFRLECLHLLACPPVLTKVWVRAASPTQQANHPISGACMPGRICMLLCVCTHAHVPAALAHSRGQPSLVPLLSPLRRCCCFPNWFLNCTM